MDVTCRFYDEHIIFSNNRSSFGHILSKVEYSWPYSKSRPYSRVKYNIKNTRHYSKYDRKIIGHLKKLCVDVINISIFHVSSMWCDGDHKYICSVAKQHGVINTNLLNNLQNFPPTCFLYMLNTRSHLSGYNV